MEWGVGWVLGFVIGYATGRQKPWWKLSAEEKKKRMPLVIALGVLAVLGLVVFLLFSLKLL